MKQTYNVGYLQTPSVKHLANVKQALADTGLASPTTPNEMLPTAIEEGLQVYKEKGQVAENLKDNLIENGYVTEDATLQEVQEIYENSVEPTLKKYSLKSTQIGFVEFNYVYVTKDKKWIYGQPRGKNGLQRYSVETGETTTILGSGKWDKFFETNNGTVFFYSSDSSNRGLYMVQNIDQSVYAVQVLFSDNDVNYYYYLYEANNVVYIRKSLKLYKYNYSTNVATLFFSLSGGSLSVDVFDNELYTVSGSSGNYSFNYYDGEEFILISQQENSFALPSSSDKPYRLNNLLYYVYSYSNVFIFNKENSMFFKFASSYNTSNKLDPLFYDGNGNLYFNSTYLYFLDGNSVVPLTDTQNRVLSVIQLDNGSLISFGANGLVSINGSETNIISNESFVKVKKINGSVYCNTTKKFYKLVDNSLISLYEIDSSLKDVIQDIIYSDFSKRIYLPAPSSFVGHFSLIIYDGQTFDRIIPLLLPNYSYVSKEGKAYFSNSPVTSLKYGDAFLEETEEGLVQKIYLGD